MPSTTKLHLNPPLVVPLLLHLPLQLSHLTRHPRSLPPGQSSLLLGDMVNMSQGLMDTMVGDRREGSHVFHLAREDLVDVEIPLIEREIDRERE